MIAFIVGNLSEETNFNGFENIENNIHICWYKKYIDDRFYDNHLNPIRNFSTFKIKGAVLKDELSLIALPRIDSNGNILW